MRKSASGVGKVLRLKMCRVIASAALLIGSAASSANAERVLTLLIPDLPDEITKRVSEVIAQNESLRRLDLTINVAKVASDDSLMNNLQNGSADFSMIPLELFSDLNEHLPYTQLLLEPAVWQNLSSLFTVQDSEYRSFIKAEIGERNVIVLSFWNRGTTHFFSEEVISEVGDLNGLKFRSFGDNPLTYDVMSAMGATPVYLRTPELYLNLKEGKIKGAEVYSQIEPFIAGPDYTLVTDSSRLYGYRPKTGIIAANVDSWTKLTERERFHIENTLNEAEQISRTLALNSEAQALAQFEEQGLTLESSGLAGIEFENEVFFDYWVERAGKEGVNALDLLIQINKRGLQQELNEEERKGSLDRPPRVLFATDRVLNTNEAELRFQFGIKRSVGHTWCGEVDWDHESRRSIGAPYSGEISLSSNTLFKENECVKFVTEVVNAEENKITVFVPGFSNTFYSSVSRSISVVEDLEIESPLLVWSWPSMGQQSAYMYDSESIEFTRSNFIKFLESLSAIENLTHFDLISHSMGGRLGIQALGPLAKYPSVARSIIFVAPDVPVSTFVDRFERNNETVNSTLYASENDIALRLSQSSLLNNEKRAGIGGESILVSPFFESVDASKLEVFILDALASRDFNHSHALSIPRAIKDLSMLLTRRLGASDRGLISMKKNELTYWVIPGPIGN